MVGVKKREIFVYFAIIMYCVALFLKRVNLPIDESICNKIMTLGAILAVANIFLDYKMEIRQMILTAVVGGLLFLDSIPTGNHEIFYLFLVIWSCRNVDSKKVMKVIAGIVLGMTVLIGILTMIGVVENEMFVLNEVRKRYGLGYNVWSILPFQFISLSMMGLYFSKKKIKLWWIVVLLGIGTCIGILTDVRSASAILAAGLFALYVGDRIKIKKWKRLKFLIWVPEVLLVLSMIAVNMYSKGIHFFVRLNEILNCRLMYPAIGIEQFGFRLFSNPEVKMISDPDAYFGIDNNYISLLLVWGIVGVTVVLIMYSYLIDYCIKKEDLRLLILIMLMLLVGLMWSRLLVLIEMEFLICYSDAFMTKTKKKRVMSLECIKN